MGSIWLVGISLLQCHAKGVTILKKIKYTYV